VEPLMHIVSFIDQWNEHIAWVNPETMNLLGLMLNISKKTIRTIAISKVEEFASILDDSVDTSFLESVPFIQRVPVGMYVFTYLQENGMDLSYQVMVYDSTVKAYEQLMKALPELFATYKIEDEYLTDNVLEALEEHCRDTFFCGEMIPPYESRDVVNILKYYAQYEEMPKFYTFAEVDRSKLDISKIAQYIWDEDMGQRKKNEYLDEIWNSSDDNMLRLYFGKKVYFMKQLDIELMKISNPDIYKDTENNVVFGKKYLENLPLYEIGKINPNLERELRDSAFEKSRNEKGEYCCTECGLTATSRIPFQVDHIIPMNKGGKSVPENLQILCRTCNGTKGDA
jgi:ATP-dependent helicase IRC3